MVDKIIKERFYKLVSDAYTHIYDLVYLRSHPLSDLIFHMPGLRHGEKAQRLHHLLLDIIDEFDPGPQAPIFSKEWRRHRLLVLHLVDGLDAQEVASQLNISRRHYYRELDTAIQATANLLWDRYVLPYERQMEDKNNVPDTTSSNRLELLRLEAGRLSQSRRYTGLSEIVAGVNSLVQDTLQRQRIHLQVLLPSSFPNLVTDHNLIRQMLLVVLGSLIKRVEGVSINITAHMENDVVNLLMMIHPAEAARSISNIEKAEEVARIQEMAELSGTKIIAVESNETIIGYEIKLVVTPTRTVLVIDDNEDILELFNRYLGLHHYRVITARSSSLALDIARQAQPFAITLDLMMPGQDGWDLLQSLLNHPDTRHIPIIICSVLKQKDLALMLGATAFLEKPISEQALLAVLGALEEDIQK